MTERKRPDWAGSERSQLDQVLDYQRASVRIKCAGLDDDAARRRLVPSPLTSVAGVVSHLITVERWWLEHVVGQRDVEFPWSDEHPDADWGAGRRASAGGAARRVRRGVRHRPLNRR